MNNWTFILFKHKELSCQSNMCVCVCVCVCVCMYACVRVHAMLHFNYYLRWRRRLCFWCALFVCCVTSRSEWALLLFPDVCLSVWMSVCHSATYSLPRLIDHNQIWYAGTYLSLHPCKPLWIPCLPYSRFQMEKYGKFRLFPTLNGCHLDIRKQIKKSRRESTRMSMDSIAPKY